MKCYAIRATSEALDPAVLDAAAARVAAEPPPAGSLGFVILHRGEEAVWLLLHWWLPGGMLAERLWSASLGEPGAFQPVDRPSMACVWELVPIAFERDAYVRTMMNGGRDRDYLACVMPDGSY
ncbi:hypothetical protein [Aureimonas populi]|uniref:Antibiotic biosynthesis monooxygenase n=1 Tax=Aureimonas populi TaxID=1701758 RepID=A0ABW5CSR5_9HYPH